ncbi:hypothetical protein IV815_004121 [Salmonella enterica]|nr:hypothetical protein [Salmonella enterica]
MLKYLVLRVPQVILILSFSLPMALALSLNPSRSGFINTGMLGLYGIGITAFLWLSLARLTRNTDRCRRLTDSPEITIVNGKQVAGRMKEHEKAEIVWQVLQDDSLYYRLTGLWWRSIYKLSDLRHFKGADGHTFRTGAGLLAGSGLLRDPGSGLVYTQREGTGVPDEQSYVHGIYHNRHGVVLFSVHSVKTRRGFRFQVCLS